VSGPSLVQAERNMKPRTRDNLIYLAVALTIAGALVGLIWYEDYHGRIAAFPSRFSVRVATSLLLGAYFIAREARQANSSLTVIAICVLGGSLVQIAIHFGFRQIALELPGLAYASIASIEIFLIVELMARIRSRFKRPKHPYRAWDQSTRKLEK
jgi:hypothetical protein